MEKVVYLIGAGFSAPLGLPVMANFLPKSKDMFARDPEKFKHFHDVFRTIGEMHACKSYYEADLLNIEEILSILEMREGLESGSRTRSFINYLADVVNYYTPTPQAPPKRNSLAGNWLDSIVGKTLWSRYAAFVANLFHLNFSVSWPKATEPCVIKFIPLGQPNILYSVITLNYDLVLEGVCQFLNQHHPSEKPIDFDKTFSAENANGDFHVRLAKLHGSSDTGEIIAPTWKKAYTQSLLRLGRWHMTCWRKQIIFAFLVIRFRFQTLTLGIC
jgi:hypothetical protein